MSIFLIKIQVKTNKIRKTNERPTLKVKKKILMMIESANLNKIQRTIRRRTKNRIQIMMTVMTLIGKRKIRKSKKMTIQTKKKLKTLFLSTQMMKKNK